MSGKSLTPRQRSRLKRKFPFGMYTALLTATLVTLVGVVLRLDPMAILIRASISSIVIGMLFSIGVGIVRMSDDEQKRRRVAERR